MKQGVTVHSVTIFLCGGAILFLHDIITLPQKLTKYDY